MANEPGGARMNRDAALGRGPVPRPADDDLPRARSARTSSWAFGIWMFTLAATFAAGIATQNPLFFYGCVGVIAIGAPLTCVAAGVLDEPRRSPR
ncbi:hypothetical protein [Schumannella sp. 10F1B-5-1]|uniref:hypothetical protein n=1 Tax=Schumannella sp. 10F1B-5-1 TaxID=2590780 RepID=UPI001131BDC4|nr:hypothetical protein [Schumannella sp. 10F1B-5-1]TPW72930.1 hypothetical protein FJ658_06650 [Schumannella sp. 10F1B-5-1]